MWLAETAVNRSVLDLLAAEGIKFTILAPNQCARVRRIPRQDLATTRSGPRDAFVPPEEPEWLPTPDATVDTTRPYRVKLDEGRSIAVFFYDGPASRAIAFEGLLNSGETFGRRLLDGFHPASDDPPPSPSSPTSPPTARATATTTATARWRSPTPCTGSRTTATPASPTTASSSPSSRPSGRPRSPKTPPGAAPTASSAGAPTAAATAASPAGTRSGAAPCARPSTSSATPPPRSPKQLAAPLLTDLWAARDAYIDVVLDRSPASLDRFFDRHATHALDPAERITVLELLELERHTQLMYTSCGWFFDEISGIETVQIIAYAGRVLQLAAKLFGEPGVALEAALPRNPRPRQEQRPRDRRRRRDLPPLRHRHPHRPRTGRRPLRHQLHLPQLPRGRRALLLRPPPRLARVLHLRPRQGRPRPRPHPLPHHRGDRRRSASPSSTSATRTSPPPSAATRADDPADVAAFAAFSADIRNAIRRANLPEVIRLIDRFFGTLAYSLTSLFADEQHRILRTILDRTLAEMEDSLRKIYEDHASLLRFLTESGMAAPPALAIAANFALNASLRRAIEADNFDPAEIEALLARAAADQVTLDTAVLSFAAGQRMKRAMVAARSRRRRRPRRSPTRPRTPRSPSPPRLRAMPFDVNLWQAQNIWNDLFRRTDRRLLVHGVDAGFKKLGEALNISVDQLVIDEGVSAF